METAIVPFGIEAIERRALSDAMAFLQGLPARQAIDWCVRNRETGVSTVAQAPNFILRIVIVTGALRWNWRSGKPGVLLTVGFKGSLAIWAEDEIIRGENPWRLGAAVIVCDIAIIR